MAYVADQDVSEHTLKLVATIVAIVTMVFLFEIFPMTNCSCTWCCLSFNVNSVPNITIKEAENEEKLSYYLKQKYNKDIIEADVLASDRYYYNYDDIINNKESLSSSTSSSPPPSKSKKLVHSSIRIEQDISRSLQREADRQGIALNSLINKILKNYVTSEMYFEQLGFLLVSKDFLRKTFAELRDEKRISEFGKELGLTAAKEYVSYFFPQLNSNTLTQFLDILFRRFQSYQHRVEKIIRYNYDDVKNNNNNKDRKQQQEQQNNQSHRFTVYHDINMNFSITLKSILEGLIEPITKSPVTFRDITSNSISFSFEIRSSNTSIS